MSILNNVLPGSYKGFPIYVDVSKVEGGRKIVKHEFPNRDDQTLEDLGGKPRVYNCTLVVYGRNAQTVAGVVPEAAAYFQYKKDLLDTLDEAGAGTLNHPLFGIIPNMVATKFTLNESMDRLGDGTVEVTFEVDVGTGVPVDAGTTSATVSAKLQLANIAATAEFVSSFFVSPGYFGNIASAIKSVNGFVDKVQGALSVINDVNDGIANVNRLLADLTADAYNLVLTPQALADSINGVFSGIVNVFNAPQNILAAMSNLFEFSSDEVVIGGISTRGYDERVKNNQAFELFIKTSAYIGATGGASLITFQTVDDVDAAVDELELQNTYLMNDVDMAPASRNALTEARVTVSDVLAQKRLLAADFVPVTTPPRAARLLAYDYYGDSTQGALLASVNNQPDVSFVSGNIVVLSE